MVVDTLTLKVENMGNLAYLSIVEKPLALEIQSSTNRMVRMDLSNSEWILAFVRARSFLLYQMCGQ